MTIVERLRMTPSIAICDEAADEIERLRAELETERMRLAGCGVAALGYFDGCKDEYRSASLEDVLRLREQNTKLTRVLKAAVDLVCAPAWAGVSDEDVELERVLRECGYVTPAAQEPPHD